MTVDPNIMTIDPKIMTIDPKIVTIGPKIITIDKIVLLKETKLKITGPTDVFGENRDYKTVIREPFANNLAHMFDE